MSGTTLARLSRRCPWGLVGMIALILAVEGMINARAMDLFDVDEWAYRWTDHAVSTRAKGAQVLVFGDSLVKLGVVPSIVQERTGKKVFNLALSGSQAPTSYFLLEKALASGLRPEAIVVDFNPPLLRAAPRQYLTRWGALIGPLEAARLAWWGEDAGLFGEVALGHALPSLRGKATIRANIMGALGGQQSAYTIYNHMGLRNWRQNQGAQLMVGSAAARNLTDKAVADLREGYYPKWKVDPANVEGVDHFLALASKHKIRVFWVIAPLLPALHDKINQSGIDAEHDAFIRHWQAKYPGVVVVDARKKVAEIDAFWDPQHLSIVGASAFSRTLGDVLRRALTGKLDQTWVALPDVQIGPIPPGLENIDESRLAVEAAPKVVR